MKSRIFFLSSLALVLAGCSKPTGTKSTDGNAAPPRNLPPPTAEEIASLPKKPTAADASHIVVNILSVVGRTKAEVDKILRAPISEAQNTAAPEPVTLYRYAHKTGNVDIVYRNGIADWLTVYGLETRPFAPEEVTSIGLPPEPPTASQPNFSYTWDGIKGLREVSLFRGPTGNIRSIHVSFKTLPGPPGPPPAPPKKKRAENNSQ